MDLLPWFYAIIAIAGWEFGKWLYKKFRMKYRWRCKQCGFKVQTNNWRDYEISKTSHNHISTREYR